LRYAGSSSVASRQERIRLKRNEIYRAGAIAANAPRNSPAAFKTRELHMSANDNLPVIQDDGFEDAGTDDRVIQGQLLRFVDGIWSTRNDTPLPKMLMAIGCDNFLQHWKEQKPIETIREKPLPEGG
jgi:hypothetical protein